ncbi:MAG TPA: glycosyltransferase family 4 protein [Bacteroidales bacterium]|jgi:glycosyltransferase involved in cell wall biosynthesis|nr:glycosyltransferase family 4 protein [Bacteroidales bacterium]
MSYVIFGDLFTFPQGEASTNRVHSYAKGLTENGRKVHIICFRNDYLPEAAGELNGIKFYRPFAQKERNPNFFRRNWKKVMKFYRTASLVRKLNKDEKIRAIIVYTMLPGTFLLAWYLKIMTRSVLIQEVSEHPLRGFQKGRLNRVYGKLILRLELPMTDGILCISKFLIDFHTRLGYPLHRLLLLPSTVDPARFRINSECPFPFPYVGYFGMLSFYRDNIDVLIQAFSAIKDRYPGLNLVLGGPNYNNERDKIRQLISDLGVGERVHLLDYMEREEVIRYMVNSKVLVMVRTNDANTNASFPSKLTEYLASGKPVISVNVGEISEYLEDGKHAFLVEPGNKEKLAEKLDMVLDHYDNALSTARQGTILADTVFNYNYQAKRIIPFVDSLYKL